MSEVQSQSIKHCTIDDIGIEITGKDAKLVIDLLNKYLHVFAAEGKCPKCGSQLGGLLGSFQWGLAHGEGICTGGLYSGKCRWPCRGLHYFKNESGEDIFTQALPYVLAYHPDFVNIRGVTN